MENDRANLGVLVDPDIKVKISDSTYIRAPAKVSVLMKSKNVLSVEEINEIATACRDDKENKVYLHELLCGSEVLIPQLEIPKRNPELQRRIEALKKEQANREYRRMTKNVDASRGNEYQAEDSIKTQCKWFELHNRFD